MSSTGTQGYNGADERDRDEILRSEHAGYVRVERLQYQVKQLEAEKFRTQEMIKTIMGTLQHTIADLKSITA